MQMQMRWSVYAWKGDWVAFDDRDGVGSACNSSALTPKLTLRSIAATWAPNESRRSSMLLSRELRWLISSQISPKTSIIILRVVGSWAFSPSPPSSWAFRTFVAHLGDRHQIVCYNNWDHLILRLHNAQGLGVICDEGNIRNRELRLRHLLSLTLCFFFFLLQNF